MKSNTTTKDYTSSVLLLLFNILIIKSNSYFKSLGFVKLFLFLFYFILFWSLKSLMLTKALALV